MRQGALGQALPLAAVLPVPDQLAVHGDATGLERLERGDAAQEGGLARAGRPEHDHRLLGVDVEVDPPQDLPVAVALVDAFDFDHRTPFLVLEVAVAPLDDRGKLREAEAADEVDAAAKM